MPKSIIFIVKFLNEPQIRQAIKKCKKSGHFQQVCYSVHGNALTQICFDCQTIKTSLRV